MIDVFRRWGELCASERRRLTAASTYYQRLGDGLASSYLVGDAYTTHAWPQLFTAVH